MNQDIFKTSMPSLTNCLFKLYGKRWNFYKLLDSVASLLESESAIEQANITASCTDKLWYLDESQIGMMLYVDLFAENLDGLEEKIPYLLSLGITYVHLMPLFLSPEKQNDGGYAVSSYRKISSRFGTIKQLKKIAAKFHQNGIRLVLDFVFNHTSDEHEWAIEAKKGNPKYRDFYFMYGDKNDAEKWNKTLREIFPNERRGSFSFDTESNTWVWTTFNSFQWDLNYGNPEVFLAMCREMIALSKLGVDVLRLDALAFIWKKQGTVCENLEETHILIKAFQFVARIACPNLVLKSEAIVHPDEVIKYISFDECRLSYNPLQMALFWEAAASRNTRLLSYSLASRWKIPNDCSWVNYLRCHDDIGWTFSDEDAAHIGINAFEHRRFLNRFYTGDFTGSYSKGEPFQLNLANGDCRISGTLASLAGLEQSYEMFKAGDSKAELFAMMAVRRIIMLFGLLFALPGIPLIYAGDETAILNDYSYKKNKSHENDSRWVHRINTDWERIERIRNNQGKDWLEEQQIKVFSAVCKMIKARKAEAVFGKGGISFDCNTDSHVFAFTRSFNNEIVQVVGNFSDSESTFFSGFGFTDILSGCNYEKTENIQLKPWDVVWLKEIK